MLHHPLAQEPVHDARVGLERIAQALQLHAREHHAARTVRASQSAKAARVRLDRRMADSCTQGCRTIEGMSLVLSAQRLEPQVLLRWSVFVAAITIALKTLAWWLTGSVGLLSDAMESLVNLASAAFALLMVSIAQRPADADHPYGHHKAEYFSAGFEGLMIMVAAAGIMGRRAAPARAAAAGTGGARPGALCGEFRDQRRARLGDAAVRTHPPFDGPGRRRTPPAHRRVDLRGVVIGVGLVAPTGWLWLDPVVGILVAANILREGVHLVWKSSKA